MVIQQLYHQKGGEAKDKEEKRLYLWEMTGKVKLHKNKYNPNQYCMILPIDIFLTK